MPSTTTVNKTVTVQNTKHLDEVTVHLELEVGCSCPSPAGSYTRSEPARR
jgi:hypothetical protein